MTITSQQIDAWDAEVDAAYASGVAAGATAERALWELSRLGQEIEAQPEQHDRRLQIAMRQWEDWKAYALDLQKKLVKYEGGSPMILNTQPERPWVGLTDTEIQECYKETYKVVQGRRLEGAFARIVESKLKEKNT